MIFISQKIYLKKKSLVGSIIKEERIFDYHIDYSDAVLDAREDGRLEILVKWEPNSYCHLHKHTAETSSVVLKGELHVSDFDTKTGKETNKRIRKVGDFVHKESGDIHMEKGGPKEL